LKPAGERRSFGPSPVRESEGWQSLAECTGLENQHTFTRIVGFSAFKVLKKRF